MDGEAWWATVHRLQRVEHDRATSLSLSMDLQCKFDLSEEVFFFFTPPGISHSLCYISLELGSYLHYTSYQTYSNNFLRVSVLCKI